MHVHLLCIGDAHLIYTGFCLCGGSSYARPHRRRLLPPPIFTWTGIYLGGQIGYGWGCGNFHSSGFDPFTGIAFESSIGGKPNGVIGGANVGYQLSNQPMGSWALKARLTESGLTNTAVAAFPDGTISDGAARRADIQGSILRQVWVSPGIAS